MASAEAPDFCVDFDDGNYKSCFARSVAVNSQYNKHSGSMDPRQLPPEKKESVGEFKKSYARVLPAVDPVEAVRLRKNSRTVMDETRRLSCSSIGSSRRTSICSRITEIPMENIVQQSKVETLQWQLKETEKSREMYKAVMKQVVTFLERAHRSLELLGTKLNTKQTVPRSKSEHQIVTEEGVIATLKSSTLDDYTAFRDFTWRRPKKQEISPDEIPPEKLSQEAFRLLRTAESLLNTQEPKLTPVDISEPETDIEFLAQLAREFPRRTEVKPQRTTSFSLSPKLLTPETEIKTKISTAFNRKLSLQLNETRRTSYKYNFSSTANNSISCNVTNNNSSPLRDSVENDCFSSLNDFGVTSLKDNHSHRLSFHSDKSVKSKPSDSSEKSTSPPGGSISSVEDESGFSSMNSFQDVGLPLVGEVNVKSALLRSMLHNTTVDSAPANLANSVESDKLLWRKPEENIAHRRWSSTPVKSENNKPNMNVLWV